MSRKGGAIKSTEKPSRSNLVAWVFVLLLVVGGIVANSYYSHVAGALRAAGGLVLVIALLALAGTTTQGKKALSFFKGSRMELRKVVWPTRQETIQTTVVVVVMVFAMAVILWGVDSLFLWLVGILTGQRG